jgi:exodeoxyribonuclease X
MAAPTIRVIDLETCGEPGADGVVVEVGWTDLVSLGADCSGAPARWSIVGPYSQLCKPPRPIRPDSSAIHHIVDEDVADALPAWAVLAAVCNPARGRPVAFAAHSAKSEAAWLPCDARPWLCTYKIGLRLWPLAPAHSNQALRYLIRPAGLDRALASPAHRAGPDSYVTAHTLREALDLAPLSDLMKWSNEPALQVICRKGDWRGKRWTEVDDGFLHWCARKIVDDEDIQFTVRHEIARREAEWRNAVEQQREEASPCEPISSL